MTANRIVTIAIEELGVRESPARSGNVKYNTWYYGERVHGKNYPWCMAFVQWVFAQVKAENLLPCRTASCGTLMRAAKDTGQWVNTDYRIGDIAIYSFSKNGRADHTGIIEHVDGSMVSAIEGNTGPFSSINGGQVMRRKRKINLLLGAVRPLYDTEEEPEVRYNCLKEIPEAFRPIVEQLLNAKIILGSGNGPDGPVIDLSHDMLRLLVWDYRGGAFDSRFIEQGMEPVVKQVL